MLPLPCIEYLTEFVRTCRKERTLHSCVQCLLSYAQPNGQGTHASLGNLLVSALVDVRLTCSAHHVFDKLAERTESSCKALINGYIKLGALHRALTLYRELSTKPLQLCSYTCVALLKACTTLQDVQTGMHIHAHMGPMENHLFVATALIDMYSKCGMLDRAQYMFDRSLGHDTASWNALIAGYSQHGYGEEALSCLEDMQAQQFSPDAVTFVCSLKACGIVGNEEKGAEIHADVRKLGLLDSNVIVGNALVDMYAKCGSLSKAQEVFDALRIRNVISWTTLLSGYAQHERGQDALDCFDRMMHHNIIPDAATFACGLKACGSIRAIDKGLELHADIERRGSFSSNIIVGNALVDMYAKCGLLDNACEVFDGLPMHDVVSWTALIGGYTQHDYGEEALAIFEQMQSQDVLPNDVTVACALKACGSIGGLEKGKELHKAIEMEEMLKSSQLVCNALVDMYAKCGILEKAHESFDKLYNRDIVSWTVLLTGYAQLGETERLFHLYNVMCQEGIEPNSVTFISILNACSHAGLIEEGQIFYDAMTRVHDISPTAEHDTCIIDLLCRAGQLVKAVTVMKEMLSYPNLVLWLTVLGACRKWGDVDLGCYAFKQAMALDDRESSAYVSMCNIYADAGMQEDVRRVEQMGLKLTGLDVRMLGVE